MLRSVLLAASLVAGLHVLSLNLEPRTVAVDELDRHLGETVTVEGWVVDTRAGDRFHRVVVQDATGVVTALTEADPPPRGATVRIVGQAAGGREGTILWARGSPLVLEELKGRVLDVDVAVLRAPQLVGVPITLVGQWATEGAALAASGQRLPVSIDEPPEPGSLVAVRGTVRYAAETASYHFVALGWQPWTASESP